jgi:MFS family permease
MERYFATAMAVFSLFLSGGSQVGPMIAGFLIGAKGWRWFFILIAILSAVNLAFMLPFLPETNYRRVLYEGETAAEVDKIAVQMIENKGVHVEEAAVSNRDELNVPYAGSYWRDLINLSNRGTENASLQSWALQFSLPFRFILVPHVLFATISYGIFLGGYVLI